jgi:hypothetical protein
MEVARLSGATQWLSFSPSSIHPNAAMSVYCIQSRCKDLPQTALAILCVLVRASGLHQRIPTHEYYPGLLRYRDSFLVVFDTLPLGPVHHGQTLLYVELIAKYHLS